VNEIDLDGNIVRLTSRTVPEKELEEPCKNGNLFIMKKLLNY
jgi:hypothetical protein